MNDLFDFCYDIFKQINALSIISLIVLPMRILILAIVLISTFSIIFPPPKEETYFPGKIELKDPCMIYQMPSDHSLIQSQYYLSKVLLRVNHNKHCYKPRFFNQIQHVALTTVKNSHIHPEGYEIVVNKKGIQIQYGDYSGYVYALQSLTQLIKENQIPYAAIQDEPILAHRGIMIDTARHFIGVEAIKRLIQSMPLSRLNILHWHLADDESFSVKVESHPELANGSIFTSKSFYSIAEVKELIKLASQNGVTIIPEVDTPGHVRAWGLSQTWKAQNITILCPKGEGYNHQFDVSKDVVYEITRDVLKQLDTLFRDSPYLHLGGDEVFGSCWDLRPSIKTFMTLKGLKSYGELQMYWRFQLKMALPAGRKTIFWLNTAEHVTTSDNDIVHYWGSQDQTASITADSTSKIILSPGDLLYLNKGKGNIWLNTTAGDYTTWRMIYQKFLPFPKGVDPKRILGAEVCLWGEVSNEDTLQNNLWMRASAFGAKVWSEKIMSTANLIKYLVGIQKQLFQMNVYASPITSEFCEFYPDKCFPTSSQTVTQ